MINITDEFSIAFCRLPPNLETTTTTLRVTLPTTTTNLPVTLPVLDTATCCDNCPTCYISRNASWVFIGLFFAMWLVVGRMICNNSFVVRYFYPSISKYFGFTSFKRNCLFNVMILMLTGYLVTSAFFVGQVRVCHTRGKATSLETFAFLFQLVFGVLTLFLISPTKTYPNHYAGCRCCCCPDTPRSGCCFKVMHLIGGLAVLLGIPVGHCITYAWEMRLAGGFDQVPIAHRAFLVISCISIVLAIIFFISNFICAKEILNSDRTVGSSSSGRRGSQRVRCKKVCEDLAGCWGFTRNSTRALEDMTLGSLDEATLPSEISCWRPCCRPCYGNGKAHRIEDFGDLDDVRYLMSVKIYEGDGTIYDDTNELRTRSSTALQASRTCSMWVEYSLIFLNIGLSCAVNIEIVAEIM